MPEIPDYELVKTAGVQDAERTATPRVWIPAMLVILAAVAIAAYLVYGRRPAPAPASPVPEAVESSPAAVRPLGGQADAVVVPPLDESDSVVRELVR